MNTSLPNSNPTFSPFEPVFAGHANKIPLAFQEQFLHSPDYPFNIVLDGYLDVWFHPKWLYPLFWYLENLGILVSEIGNKVPMNLTVQAVREKNGLPVHYWNRTFQFKKERYFNTILAFDPGINKVVDFIGRNGFVFIVWEACFHPPLQLTLDTLKCALRFENHFYWLPGWAGELLFGKVHCAVDADSMIDNTYNLNLVIWHPWFGNVFGYKGRFKTIRQSKHK